MGPTSTPCAGVQLVPRRSNRRTGRRPTRRPPVVLGSVIGNCQWCPKLERPAAGLGIGARRSATRSERRNRRRLGRQDRRPATQKSLRLRAPRTNGALSTDCGGAQRGEASTRSSSRRRHPYSTQRSLAPMAQPRTRSATTSHQTNVSPVGSRPSSDHAPMSPPLVAAQMQPPQTDDKNSTPRKFCQVPVPNRPGHEYARFTASGGVGRRYRVRSLRLRRVRSASVWGRATWSTHTALGE
jgi:hypothetical protein